MVGDILEKDIYPADKAGLQTIWYNPTNLPVPKGVHSIQSLEALLEDR